MSVLSNQSHDMFSHATLANGLRRADIAFSLASTIHTASFDRCRL